mmetsp:Transcript_45898/g.73462  ORF Transcript_45898/g.73462 Transcript_45898/m.73462 type:complete len:200 (-) Transcript_45898:702-1301(-)
MPFLSMSSTTALTCRQTPMICASHCATTAAESSASWKLMMRSTWSIEPFMRRSLIILAAVRSAWSASTPSSCPSSATVMLLYSLLALNRLCSLTARASTVSPPASALLASWCGFNPRLNASTSGCRRMRSRYTFSMIGKIGSVAQRSSLYKVASTRLRCGPAAARMAHVTASVSAADSSAGPNTLPVPSARPGSVCDSS